MLAQTHCRKIKLLSHIGIGSVVSEHLHAHGIDTDTVIDIGTDTVIDIGASLFSAQL